MRGHVAAVQWLARLGSEYEAVLSPQGPRPIYLPQLPLQVASEGLRGALCEPYRPAAAFGLRRGKLRPVLGRSEGTPHPERPVFEVHVFPLQAQELALPQVT